ncbi:MAG: S41 family peptidase [Flavobacteriales bacterium]
MKISFLSNNINLKAVSVFRSGFSLLCVAIGCLLYQNSSAQSKNPVHLIYDADSLKADLMDLKEVLFTSHENPFYYIDSLEFEAEFKRRYDSITEDISLADFSLIVGGLLQRLKDSHTTLNYGSLFNYMKADSILNFNFRGMMVKDQFIITEDKEGFIPKGAELISVNRIDIKSYMDSIPEYKFLEGNSYYQSNVILSGMILRTLTMRYGVKPTNEVVYVNGGDTTTVNYPGIPFKQIRKAKTEKRHPYKLTFTDGVAFLKVGSFSAKSENKYSRFLRNSFKKIKRKKVDSLVIDLRYNLGGSVWRMEDLFTYLDGPDVLSPYSISLVKSDLSQRKYTKLLKGPFGWARMNLFQKNDKMRAFRQMALLPVGARDTVFYKDVFPKKRYAFTGEKHLFMNFASGSASVMFAGMFDMLDLGNTYGTPCLGPYGGTWGDPTPYTMPRSKLKLSIAVLRLSSTSEYLTSPESIQPDFRYEPTKEDISSETDGLKKAFLDGEFSKPKGE